MITHDLIPARPAVCRFKNTATSRIHRTGDLGSIARAWTFETFEVRHDPTPARPAICGFKNTPTSHIPYWGLGINS